MWRSRPLLCAASHPAIRESLRVAITCPDFSSQSQAADDFRYRPPIQREIGLFQKARLSKTASPREISEKRIEEPSLAA